MYYVLIYGSEGEEMYDDGDDRTYVLYDILDGKKYLYTVKRYADGQSKKYIDKDPISRDRNDKVIYISHVYKTNPFIFSKGNKFNIDDMEGKYKKFKTRKALEEYLFVEMI